MENNEEKKENAEKKTEEEQSQSFIKIVENLKQTLEKKSTITPEIEKLFAAIDNAVQSQDFTSATKYMEDILNIVKDKRRKSWDFELDRQNTDNRK